MVSKPRLKLYWIGWYDSPYPDPKAPVFAQFDLQTGKENLFKTVDQTRLKSMAFMPFSAEFAERVNGHPDSTTLAIPLVLPRYVVHLSDKQRIIIFRRNFNRYGVKPKELELFPVTQEIIYVLGWQTTELIQVNGQPQEKNIKSMMFIHENGSVEMSENYEHGSPQWTEALHKSR